jgi:hypothetical protein
MRAPSKIETLRTDLPVRLPLTRTFHPVAINRLLS